ncbi:hypothetical protein Amn_pc00160 (plasmid) [Aminobacter sp. Y103A]|nr:hypothetical protein Amn_pc00160 [Aminobacter sp. SS-2016]
MVPVSSIYPVPIQNLPISTQTWEDLVDCNRRALEPGLSSAGVFAPRNRSRIRTWWKAGVRPIAHVDPKRALGGSARETLAMLNSRHRGIDCGLSGARRHLAFILQAVPLIVQLTAPR